MADARFIAIRDFWDGVRGGVVLAGCVRIVGGGRFAR